MVTLEAEADGGWQVTGGPWRVESGRVMERIVSGEDVLVLGYQTVAFRGLGDPSELQGKLAVSASCGRVLRTPEDWDGPVEASADLPIVSIEGRPCELGGPCHPENCATDVVDFDVGQDGYCALLSDGSVRCGSVYTDSVYRDVDVSRYPREREVPYPRRAMLAMGREHVCVLLEDGGVDCWGDAFFSQLGESIPYPVSEPSRVGEVEDARLIAAYLNHTCALTRTGSLVCWGESFLGLQEPREVIVGTQGMDAQAVELVVGSSRACFRSASEVYCMDGPQPSSWFDGPARSRSASAMAMYGSRLCVAEPDLVRCWPDGYDMEPSTTHLVVGTLVDLDLDATGWCGVRADGRAYCERETLEMNIGEPVRAIRQNTEGSTAGTLTSANRLLWHRVARRSASFVRAMRPGPYRSVDAARGRTCLVREAGGVECIGSNALDSDSITDIRAKEVAIVPRATDVHLRGSNGGCLRVDDTWHCRNAALSSLGYLPEDYRWPRADPRMTELSASRELLFWDGADSCQLARDGHPECTTHDLRALPDVTRFGSHGALFCAGSSTDVTCWASRPDPSGCRTSQHLYDEPLAPGDLVVSGENVCALDAGRLACVRDAPWSQLTGVRAAAGGDCDTFCVIVSDELRCWGSVFEGSEGAVIPTPSPPRQIAVGYQHVVALLEDGSAFLIGSNEVGQVAPDRIGMEQTALGPPPRQ